jgi:hypothetical protein
VAWQAGFATEQRGHREKGTFQPKGYAARGFRLQSAALPVRLRTILPADLTIAICPRQAYRGLLGSGFSGLNSSVSCFGLPGARAKDRAMAGYALGSSIRSNSIAKQLLTASVGVVSIINAMYKKNASLKIGVYFFVSSPFLVVSV